MTAKRILDYTVSITGIILLAPLLVLLGVAIKLVMPHGPVIFKQKRVGRHGRLFTMYKFRTMDTDAPIGTTVTVAGQSHVTPLGKCLRRFKLDELPQLWNVLKGEMSLVGPRPDVTGYADTLTGSDRDVLSLYPGITGPATLKYRDEEELLATQDDPLTYNDTVIYPDKVRINLYYLNNYSFTTDLHILFCTIFGQHMRYNGETI